ncbi:hypothetical protein BDP27DRAFT_329065 [Rhodocollybia butyracea]|uniref:Uncharacterized protein n=1 Tax=Rhodocollybia butyracea TaxID=206335 RepID=A0A9P5QAV1_9AGAR|nr:hypothetical protein BDP27DRAFT_329065 [Rhodocollybia butyracea]
MELPRDHGIGARSVRVFQAGIHIDIQFSRILLAMNYFLAQPKLQVFFAFFRAPFSSKNSPRVSFPLLFSCALSSYNLNSFVRSSFGFAPSLSHSFFVPPPPFPLDNWMNYLQCPTSPLQPDYSLSLSFSNTSRPQLTNDFSPRLISLWQATAILHCTPGFPLYALYPLGNTQKC